MMRKITKTYQNCEADLVTKFTSLEGEFFKGINFHTEVSTKKEVDIGYGISDIFYYTLQNETIAERKEISDKKIGDKSIIEILIKIGRRKSISKNCFDKLVEHHSPGKQKKIYRYLLESNLIRLSSEGKIIIAKKYLPKLKSSIAIEAKLKNWKRALFQAYRYNFVADKSFVVLPEKNIKPALANISEFEFFNVGLIGVTDTEIIVHYKPKKNLKSKKNPVLTGMTLESLIF